MSQISSISCHQNTINNISNPCTQRRVGKINCGPATDVFQKSHDIVIPEKNYEGKTVLNYVQTHNGCKIKKLDGTVIYQKDKTLFGEIEIIFSKKGVKLYDIKTNIAGKKIKTIYDKSGKIKCVIEYDKEGNVTKKKVGKAYQVEQNKKTNTDKLPEYIYHITSKKNLESILESQKIKATDKDCHLKKGGNKAVFLADGKNLLEQYTNLRKDSDSRYSYLTRLLYFCDKEKEGEVVVLKIKTSDLDLSKLKFRRQNQVLEEFGIFEYPKEDTNGYFAAGHILDRIKKDRKKGSGSIEEDIFMQETKGKLVDGEPINEMDCLESEPVEILYMGDIPSDAIKNAKVVNISSIEDAYKISPEKAEEVAASLLEKVIV